MRNAKCLLKLQPLLFPDFNSHSKTRLLSSLIHKSDNPHLPQLTLQKASNLPEVTQLAWWQSGVWAGLGDSQLSHRLW